jgi:hypothetical protein
MEVGVSAKRRLGGARADALARGAWPWPCVVHNVGAAYGQEADGCRHGPFPGPQRRLRCPYAGLPRGRHVGVQKGARELVLERGDGDAGCLFYFICADSKMKNSLKWQLS